MLIATGTGRCGTKTMSKLFGMIHEYRNDDLNRSWYYQHGQNQGDPFPDRLKTLKQRFHVLNVAAWRESNAAYLTFIPDIWRLDPAARIVFLVRSLPDFVRSVVARGWHDRGVWSMCPEPGTAAARKWVSWTPVERCAWIWTWRNRTALDALEAAPLMCRWKIVPTERIYDCAAEISAFYGVPFDRHVAADRQRHNPTKGHTLPPAVDWPVEWYSSIWKIAGDLPSRLTKHMGF